MSGGGAYGDPVGTIRREIHPAEVEVHKSGHEGPGYTIWVLTAGPGGARSWMRVESTNWDYGFALSFGNADTWTEIVGVVPGTEADRQSQKDWKRLEDLRRLVGQDPDPERMAKMIEELES